MYIASVVLLMFVLPVVSILAELFVFKSPAGLMPLVGKWFVFWGIGVRMGMAGLRQVINPQFTAQEIFEIKGPEPLPIVRELGLANTSFGILGLVSIGLPGWAAPAALVGGLYYGFAGTLHVFRRVRNLTENVAMISDLLIFLILAAFVIATIAR